MESNGQATIIGTSYFSLNFPSHVPAEIGRDNVISMIENLLFEAEKNVVVVTGEEGIGKTTLLRQFAEKNSSKVVSSFLNPFQQLYSPYDLVQHDFYHQIYWLIHGKEFEEQAHVDTEDLIDIFFALKRQLRRRNANIVLLVDGLEHINDSRTLRSILNTLQFGDPAFKILLSGKEEMLRDPHFALPPKVQVASVYLLAFSMEETRKYFEDVDQSLGDEALRHIWLNANKGVPGRLQAIKRAVKEFDGTIAEFLDEFENLEDIHQLDWNYLIDLDDPLAIELVKFISLDEGLYSVKKISAILSNEEKEVKSTLKKLQFLTINSKEEVVFNSLASKRFFVKRFSEHKNDVIRANIEYYLKRIEEAEALIELPRYYVQGKDDVSLVRLLNEDYFPRVVMSSESMSIVQKLLQDGRAAAKRTEDDLKLLSFSLYGSLLENMEGLRVWGSELEARIELGDYNRAISLANSALLKEDRLRLLAKIAKVIKRRGEVIEGALLEQIRQLYSVVDLVELGEKAIDIAADLFYSMPELALKLIRDSSGRENTSLNDWMLAKLTISAIDAKENVDPSNVTAFINNPKIKEISNSLTYLFGKFSSDEVLAEARRLSDPVDRVTFLRLWISDNLNDQDLKTVLSFLIDQMIESSSKEFVGVSLLRDVSNPLARIDDLEAVSKMVDTLLSFKDDARSFGANLEYFQFIINLFKAKLRFNYNEAFGLFFELNEAVDQIDDSTTKLECLATLTKCLNEITVPLNRAHQYLVSTLRSKVENLVIAICDTTACHFDNLKDSIEIIASYDPQFAIKACLRANTVNRRDRLLLSCWGAYTSSRSDSLELSTLKAIYNPIESIEQRNVAIRVFVQNIFENNYVCDASVIQFIKAEILSIASLSLRAYCLVHFIRFLFEGNFKEDTINECKEALDLTWNHIDTDIAKIETGFLIAGGLAKVDSKYATNYLKNADEIKAVIWPDSLNTVLIYSTCIRLLIRIYVALIKTKQNSDIHFQKIRELINNIPSPVARIDLWAYFGFFLNQKGEHNLRERVVVKEIRPLLNDVRDQSLWREIFADLCPLLYLNGSLETVEKIATLPESEREKALTAIIDSFLDNGFPGEPFEDDGDYRRPTYEQLVGVTHLLERLDQDNTIYTRIESVAKIMSDTKNYSAVQREDMQKRLSSLIDLKLPNPRFIRHPGYKLIARAQLIRLQKDGKEQERLLDSIIRDIETQVDNSSDKAFIFIVLADLLPVTRIRKYDQLDLINKALEIVEGVSCDYDFIDRVDFLCKSIHRVNPPLWRAKVKEAFVKTVRNFYRNTMLGMQKRLLDKAHKYDPSFAKSLIASIDTDESRIEYRKGKFLKDHYETLEIKQKIINERVSDSKWNGKNVAMACGKALASLNSDTITTKKTVDLRELLDYATKLPILEAEPIYSYYLQNLLKRRESSAEIIGPADSMFNSIYSICKVVEILSSKNKHAGTRTLGGDLTSTSILVKVGDREAGIGFIRDWLRENEKTTYVKIVDPYFTATDLEIIKMILEISDKISIEILTSGETPFNRGNKVAESYSDHWRGICEQRPPLTRVTIATCARSDRPKSPFHDRWILTESAGIRLGTSLNSIGISKDSEISLMSVSEKERIEQDIFDAYFNCSNREKDGLKIEYLCFSLQP